MAAAGATALQTPSLEAGSQAAVGAEAPEKLGAGLLLW
jgi:hypothetical protein